MGSHNDSNGQYSVDNTVIGMWLDVTQKNRFDLTWNNQTWKKIQFKAFVFKVVYSLSSSNSSLDRTKESYTSIVPKALYSIGYTIMSRNLRRTTVL